MPSGCARTFEIVINDDETRTVLVPPCVIQQCSELARLPDHSRIVGVDHRIFTVLVKHLDGDHGFQAILEVCPDHALTGIVKTWISAAQLKLPQVQNRLIDVARYRYLQKLRSPASTGPKKVLHAKIFKKIREAYGAQKPLIEYFVVFCYAGLKEHFNLSFEGLDEATQTWLQFVWEESIAKGKDLIKDEVDRFKLSNSTVAAAKPRNLEFWRPASGTYHHRRSMSSSVPSCSEPTRVANYSCPSMPSTPIVKTADADVHARTVQSSLGNGNSVPVSPLKSALRSPHNVARSPKQVRFGDDTKLPHDPSTDSPEKTQIAGPWVKQTSSSPKTRCPAQHDTNAVNAVERVNSVVDSLTERIDRMIHYVQNGDQSDSKSITYTLSPTSGTRNISSTPAPGRSYIAMEPSSTNGPGSRQTPSRSRSGQQRRHADSYPSIESVLDEARPPALPTLGASQRPPNITKSEERTD
ncbi:hypothetical protein BDV96DRAFT_667964 [Lophiotrema nucula]|uniref:Uncharacterized protein n=1 Tax=Lophiotrema nucula TaxID=690887 RepID=A0A6A5ZR33_9PLEO|nr:hypothetical protein BDV96DRAFT_667964 [Lophiotrema nucula]